VKLYGPKFAVMLARLIGYRDPLIQRLRDPKVKKDQKEHEFVASRLVDSFKWPTPNQVIESREKLRRAAYYLEFLKAQGSPLTTEEAAERAAERCNVDARTIRRAVKYAKELGDGEWWKSALHLARKGPRKRPSLHRTY
jgi:hypothetical protein